MAKKRDQRPEPNANTVVGFTADEPVPTPPAEASAPAAVAEAPVVQTAAVPADRRVSVQVGKNGDAYFLRFDKDIGLLELTRVEALTITAALFAELVRAELTPAAVP